MKKKIIGITGQIAAGKSVVREILAEKGFFVIDADEVSRLCMKKRSGVYQKILACFGESVLQENGEIDRAKLGDAVFSDSVLLDKLEKIAQPAIAEEIAHIVLNSDAKNIALEAVHLIEANFDGFCDEVWIVTRSEENAKRRLEKRGLDEKRISARLTSQKPPQIERANIEIKNDSDLPELRRRVEEILGENYE